MKYKIYLVPILLLFFTACQDNHSHENIEEDHSHEDVKLLLTAYSKQLEVFAEADPFHFFGGFQTFEWGKSESPIDRKRKGSKPSQRKSP